MTIRKGRTDIISRDEQNGTKKIIEVRNTRGVGGLRVGSEVKDRTGLNSTPPLMAESHEASPGGRTD